MLAVREEGTRPPTLEWAAKTDPALIGWQRLGGGGHAASLWKTDRIGNDVANC